MSAPKITTSFSPPAAWSFSLMPVEITDYIFTFLGPKTLKNCALLNSLCNSVACKVFEKTQKEKFISFITKIQSFFHKVIDDINYEKSIFRVEEIREYQSFVAGPVRASLESEVETVTKIIEDYKKNEEETLNEFIKTYQAKYKNCTTAKMSVASLDITDMGDPLLVLASLADPLIPIKEAVQTNESLLKSLDDNYNKHFEGNRKSLPAISKWYHIQLEHSFVALSISYEKENLFYQFYRTMSRVEQQFYKAYFTIANLKCYIPPAGLTPELDLMLSLSKASHIACLKYIENLPNNIESFIASDIAMNNISRVILNIVDTALTFEDMTNAKRSLELLVTIANRSSAKVFGSRNNGSIFTQTVTLIMRSLLAYGNFEEAKEILLGIEKKEGSSKKKLQKNLKEALVVFVEVSLIQQDFVYVIDFFKKSRSIKKSYFTYSSLVVKIVEALFICGKSNEAHELLKSVNISEDSTDLSNFKRIEGLYVNPSDDGINPDVSRFREIQALILEGSWIKAREEIAKIKEANLRAIAYASLYNISQFPQDEEAVAKMTQVLEIAPVRESFSGSTLVRESFGWFALARTMLHSDQLDIEKNPFLTMGIPYTVNYIVYLWKSGSISFEESTKYIKSLLSSCNPGDTVWNGYVTEGSYYNTQASSLVNKMTEELLANEKISELIRYAELWMPNATWVGIILLHISKSTKSIPNADSYKLLGLVDLFLNANEDNTLRHSILSFAIRICLSARQFEQADAYATKFTETSLPISDEIRASLLERDGSQSSEISEKYRDLFNKIFPHEQTALHLLASGGDKENFLEILLPTNQNLDMTYDRCIKILPSLLNSDFFNGNKKLLTFLDRFFQLKLYHARRKYDLLDTILNLCSEEILTDVYLYMGNFLREIKGLHVYAVYLHAAYLKRLCQRKDLTDALNFYTLMCSSVRSEDEGQILEHSKMKGPFYVVLRPYFTKKEVRNFFEKNKKEYPNEYLICLMLQDVTKAVVSVKDHSNITDPTLKELTRGLILHQKYYQSLLFSCFSLPKEQYATLVSPIIEILTKKGSVKEALYLASYIQDSLSYSKVLSTISFSRPNFDFKESFQIAKQIPDLDIKEQTLCNIFEKLLSHAPDESASETHIFQLELILSNIFYPYKKAETMILYINFLLANNMKSKAFEILKEIPIIFLQLEGYLIFFRRIISNQEETNEYLKRVPENSLKTRLLELLYPSQLASTLEQATECYENKKFNEAVRILNKLIDKSSLVAQENLYLKIITALMKDSKEEEAYTLIGSLSSELQAIGLTMLSKHYRRKKLLREAKKYALEIQDNVLKLQALLKVLICYLNRMQETLKVAEKKTYMDEAVKLANEIASLPNSEIVSSKAIKNILRAVNTSGVEHKGATDLFELKPIEALRARRILSTREPKNGKKRKLQSDS